MDKNWEIQDAFLTKFIFMSRDDFKEAQECGCTFSKYRGIEHFDNSTVKKSEYSDIIREMKPEEVVIVAKQGIEINSKFSKSMLVDKILDYLGKEAKEVFSKSRKRIHREPRQIIQAMLLFCAEEDIIERLSLSQIGVMTGYFDHATILNSKRVIKNYYETDKVFRLHLEKLMRHLKIKLKALS